MNRQHLEALFTLSPIELYAATPIVNTYPGSQTIHGPVWECMTDMGLIHVGWRKRVISIQWDRIGQLLHPMTLSSDSCGIYTRWVTTDDTDQGSTYVHAYSYHAAVKYLGELYRVRELLK